LQPVGSAPQELAAVVSGDMPKWAKIVQDAHIQLD
ncbi:MAG TPA: ABC transporter substrate-binding protein, partial [Cupriavidus sp.]|nr:ABC transporter substrate-binding protein [Cupriavidus sp.]